VLLVDVATTIQVADALSVVLSLPRTRRTTSARLRLQGRRRGRGLHRHERLDRDRPGQRRRERTNTVRGAAFWKRASGANETPPTVTSTDTDAWCAAVVCVRGAYAADNPIGTYATNTDSSGAPYTANPSQAVDAFEGGLYLVMGRATAGCRWRPTRTRPTRWSASTRPATAWWWPGA